jgi:hypothetical protein
MATKEKTLLVSAIMLILVIGTLATYSYNMGVNNTLNDLRDENNKLLDLVENLGAGDGERGDTGAWMTFTVIHEDGSRVIAWEGHNAMTPLGLDYICEQVSGTQSTDMDWLAIGDGTGGTTTLNNELFRAQGSYTAGSTGVFTIDYTWVATTFSGEVITEAGTLNQASTGVLFNYQTFSGITLTVTDSLAVEFEFTFS